MRRGSATSGGPSHVALVKLASKRIIDQFDNLRHIQITYETREFDITLKLKDTQHGYTNAHFEFRPDIIVRAESKTEDKYHLREDKVWKSISDSSAIIFEIETHPKEHLFKNILKMEAYKVIKSRPYGRSGYAFVLVVWEDADLPDNIEPFDEVWKFPIALREPKT